MYLIDKYFLVLLLSLVSFNLCKAHDEEMQELIDQLHRTCVGETSVEEELITKARTGDFADDDKLKCYMKCILDQMACVDDDGIIDEDAMIALLPEDKQSIMGPIIKKCGTQKGSSACENVWLTNKCYYKESPALYFLP